MAKGKAAGINRDYQVLARTIVETFRFKQELVPYNGDGIDVGVDMGGSTWTFDFALTTPDRNNLVVGECKRWASPIKQNHIAAFAYQVELLRKVTGKSVAALYFTKTDYQAGAIKSAVEPGIEVIVCREDQCLERFFITYFTYDAARETEVRKHVDYAAISLPNEPN